MMEPIIRILDEDTANKIAAGEVVERPASAVKELVENALDAGASEVTVELEDGGKRLIRVTDNGTGMSRQDALLSIQRHATSKIRSADDLFSISTLGFRGEALPSIASVSRMQMVTRRDEDNSGTLVVCEGSEVTDVSDIGAPVGTSITVRDLFFNVPARQKFLKTAQTELGHSLDLLYRFIVSYPGVTFTLNHKNRVVIKSQASNRPEDSVLTVFGRDAAESVIPIFGRSGPYEVRGFVSKPSYSKQNRSGQMFFVNGRYVRNRNLIHALDDAYRGILPQGRFPLIIAFVEVDPRLVDVNVHPTKIEVKFVKEWEAHNVMATAVRDALASAAVSPTGEDFLPRAAPGLQRSGLISTDHRHSRLPGFKEASDDDLASFRMALAARLEAPEKNDPTPPVLQDASISQALSEEADSTLLSGAVVLAQAKNMYIVAQNQAALILIDQHAAHERVLVEKLSTRQKDVDIQRLVIPLTLELGRRESLVLESKLEELELLGFQIEAFGKDTFIVRGIPALIAEKNYEQIIRDILSELTEMTVAKRLLVQKDAIIYSAACKMAIKAGDPLSMDEMSSLISQLKETSNPYLCPHGRPTIVCLSNRDLLKMFGRV